ncbi:MAG: imidazolonepropionase [Gammaproteobacteria bacterium]|nr:imidazolonepropionase [Gammaproteobacteria bacterium]MBT8111772.1 imidazolonepropionase [Gammaproteobacteria bacterium]NND47170.1 imidazolonepropionase [Woeseiaceae bacterium]NNL46471.1 imidazolonepropionase [Woeseiaceae bacterium]
MAGWDLLLTDARIATLAADSPDYGEIRDGAIAIADGCIAWLGPGAERPAHKSRKTRSLGGQWVTPALIDCHTHLVFAGERSQEFEQRLEGASYEAIAIAGGGILSTVQATRAASANELFDAGLARVKALAAEGVATIEIKSGYGLDVENELKMLEVSRRLGESTDLTIRTTLLAAHTVPPEFDGKVDDYIDLISNTLLPEVAKRGLADAVDAYCESIAFSAPQIAKLFRQAIDFDLPVKLHADQLSDGGGAELAAYFNALSADHLEYTSVAGVEAMAKAGAVAVLLPGAFLTLRETQQPPVDALRKNGVPIAVASDCNPGTSPICSLRTAMILASRLFGLTPLECIAGTTREAARALGLLQDRGTLEVGKRADIAIWNISHPRELAYWIGTPQLADLIIGGHTTRP